MSGKNLLKIRKNANLLIYISFPHLTASNFPVDLLREVISAVVVFCSCLPSHRREDYIARRRVLKSLRDFTPTFHDYSGHTEGVWC